MERLITSCKANCNCVAADGTTPLIIAARSGFAPGVGLLVKGGASTEGECPLYV